MRIHGLWPSQAWCPSIQSASCGGSRTELPLDCPALAVYLWRVSLLSGAGAVPAPVSGQTAAHTAPYRRRTYLPAGRDTKKHQGQARVISEVVIQELRSDLVLSPMKYSLGFKCVLGWRWDMQYISNADEMNGKNKMNPMLFLRGQLLAETVNMNMRNIANTVNQNSIKPV